MKKIILFVILMIYPMNFLFAQYPCPLPDSIIVSDVPGKNMSYSNVELRIFNHTLYNAVVHFGTEQVDTIKVRIIPVGFVFNGYYDYSSRARFYTQPDTQITGYDIFIPPQTSYNIPSYKSGNFDQGFGNNLESQFTFGHGKYKFEFYRKEYIGIFSIWELSDYVILDWSDAKVHTGLPGEPYGDMYDMRLDYFSKDTIAFQHAVHYTDDLDHGSKFWHINVVNREIKLWNFFGSCAPPLVPGKGNFKADSSFNGAYLKWPIDANHYNGNIGHLNRGDIGMNLKINFDVETNNDLPTLPTEFKILPQCFLIVDVDKTFILKRLFPEVIIS